MGQKLEQPDPLRLQGVTHITFDTSPADMFEKYSVIGSLDASSDALREESGQTPWIAVATDLDIFGMGCLEHR
jgi:hypothetical protein